MAGTLDLPSMEQRLDHVPALAGPRTVEELPGGLTNVNLKVTTSKGVFVARCFGSDEGLLGIDREAEHLNTLAAARAGVGAPVVDFRPELGILVLDYIDGSTYDNSSFLREGVIARVAAACRALHAGPRFVNDFDMFDRQRRYLRIVRERGFSLPTGYEKYDAAFQEVRRALAVHAPDTVPCNNDLLAGNFIDDGQRLWLIDYEYSGNNDPSFELGNTATECDLDGEQLAELVVAYHGRELRNQLARARLQALTSQYGWSLWGAIQAATSTLDFDFDSWCLERFEKAAVGFTDADFPRLLEEVTRDD
ncbi:MAG: Choline kinase [uncultured Nocardioidaceae bacterium]|uniref:Choline kinase n=1 Tax=uncultured Nocardioidaceae bacterium TaxID=253824 RepID=A0A6J4M5I2_9ACTN|nr:MAG: Choline kinase [uncultured Nocardioidaceae bacterium]